MFGPNRDENTPLVWSVVASHWVKCTCTAISDTFGLIGWVVYHAHLQHAKSLRRRESVGETPTAWMRSDVALLGDGRLHDSYRDTHGVCS